MKEKLSPEEVSKVIGSLEGCVLIVEGKKDESALRRLLSACPSPKEKTHIVRIDSRPIDKAAMDAVFLMEKHKNTQVIILTDFDRTGSRLASRLRLLLQSRRIHANSRIRRDVMNLGIRCIEEMASIPLAEAFANEQSACMKASRGNVRKRLLSRFSPNPVSGIVKLRECDGYGEISANFYEIRDKGLHKGKRRDREA